MECEICCDKNVEVKCLFCHKSACLTCVKIFLNEGKLVVCLFCNNEYSDQFINELNFSQKYKKELLTKKFNYFIDLQRSKLPEYTAKIHERREKLITAYSKSKLKKKTDEELLEIRKRKTELENIIFDLTIKELAKRMFGEEIAFFKHFFKIYFLLNRTFEEFVQTSVKSRTRHESYDRQNISYVTAADKQKKIDLSKYTITKTYNHPLSFYTYHYHANRTRFDEIFHEYYQLTLKETTLQANIKNKAKENIPKLKNFGSQCLTPECKGFLSSEGECAVCDKWYCLKCYEPNTEDHICDVNSIKSIELLKRTAKPCPQCHQLITKIDGCNHMWCTMCHVGFSWVTGEIERKGHNPHYLAWLRSQNIETIPVPLDQQECINIFDPTMSEQVIENLSQINLPHCNSIFFTELFGFVEDLEYRTNHRERTRRRIRSTNRYQYCDDAILSMELSETKAEKQYAFINNLFLNGAINEVAWVKKIIEIKKETVGITEFIALHNLLRDYISNLLQKVLKNSFTIDDVKEFYRFIAFFNENSAKLKTNNKYAVSLEYFTTNNEAQAIGARRRHRNHYFNRTTPIILNTIKDYETLENHLLSITPNLSQFTMLAVLEPVKKK